MSEAIWPTASPSPHCTLSEWRSGTPHLDLRFWNLISGGRVKGRRPQSDPAENWACKKVYPMSSRGGVQKFSGGAAEEKRGPCLCTKPFLLAVSDSLRPRCLTPRLLRARRVWAWEQPGSSLWSELWGSLWARREVKRLQRTWQGIMWPITCQTLEMVTEHVMRVVGCWCLRDL